MHGARLALLELARSQAQARAAEQRALDERAGVHADDRVGVVQRVVEVGAGGPVQRDLTGGGQIAMFFSRPNASASPLRLDGLRMRPNDDARPPQALGPLAQARIQSNTNGPSSPT